MKNSIPNHFMKLLLEEKLSDRIIPKITDL